MRFDPILDSFYALGSLWGILTAPPICSANPYATPGAGHEVAWTPAPRLRDGVTAFVDVNVVPLDRERVLAHQTVLVAGGRITALGPVATVTVPVGAVRVDGRGKYLIPGLADMHGHLGAGLQNDDYEPRVRLLFDYLAHGVTSVRQVGVSSQTAQITLRLKTASAAGEILGPRLYLAPPIPWTQKNGLTPRLDSVAAYAAAAKAAGYNFLALPARLEDAIHLRSSPNWRPEWPDVVDSLLTAARRVGLPVSSHAHRAAFQQMLALGPYGGSTEHLYAFRDTLGRQDAEISAAALQAVATRTQRAGTWATVTLTCYVRAPNRGPSLLVARQLVKALQEAGAGLLLGADLDIPSWSSPSIVHTELAELVRAGLTPYQALLTGTRNVAQYFGELDSAGTVAVGKRADLVLLHGNPLADIRHTRELAGVMIRGRWLDRAALDQGLLADPTRWFTFAVKRSGIMPHPGEKSGQFTRHSRTFLARADSLVAATPAAQAGVRRRLAEDLGAIRASLTPEQQETFDPAARVWLRAQARQGARVAVPGVTPVP